MQDEFDAECQEVLSVIHRVDALERDNKSLRALFNARVSGFPFERGQTYVAAGDPVPSRGSPCESLAGNIYAFKDEQRYNVACKLVKNESGASLSPGSVYQDGVVDSKLTRSVEPNNFCYIEI